MKLAVFSLAALTLASACMTVPRHAVGPHTSIEPTELGKSLPSVLPSGVAVLHDYPKCDFDLVGEVKVTNFTIDITPSRIKALREQAALYGADALVVHPNLPVCADGTHPPLCPGRGNYVIASAIKYTDTPPSRAEEEALEYKFQRGYDTIEIYTPEGADLY